ncbi:MAG: S-methyl-5-thioribose-1-phosphate isomerase [Gammaproteobacteria bacterium]|nr:S-methyl-5-thioribose-1-phosphate isomerase [Gammaproteobacteria bacterium]
MSVPEPIRWQDGELYLLDQRRLPGTVDYLRIDSIDAAVDAIATLAVRGAPAIGIAAAYALASAMARDSVAGESRDAFLARLNGYAERLVQARPTAVNLAWAVARLERRAGSDASVTALADEAAAIHRENSEICRAIGRHGEVLIEAGTNILTHCNAGSLAVAGLGTATAPMYLRHEAGVPFRVLVDETRPLLQGARLTAWELAAAGIDVTLICDNMAASFMARGEVDLVLVGTDRVTGNGDVVNKIGTLNLAVLCRHFDIPFYVACPSSTYDPQTGSGADVEIEERDPEEVLGSAAARVPARNPAFDVTPAELVTGVITERGIARAPLGDNLARLMARNDR